MCVVWLYTGYVVEVPSSKLSLDVLLSDNRGYFEVWDPPCTLGWSLTTCFFFFISVVSKYTKLEYNELASEDTRQP